MKLIAVWIIINLIVVGKVTIYFLTDISRPYLCVRDICKHFLSIIGNNYNKEHEDIKLTDQIMKKVISFHLWW